MNILFHKMRTGKKGQIAAVLTMALVVFIIAAFIVVNSGKRQVQDAKITNAARAGVLAGGSTACVLLNTMAGLNDSMILNFAGFSLMTQYLIISWIIDFTEMIILAFTSLAPGNYVSVTDIILATAALTLTTWTIEKLIEGAFKTGDIVKKMIDELNDKLPRQSRDSARQYAFSNVGVDEPKIPFSKSGCADAWCYSLIETKFDMFMRTLATTNRNDNATGPGNAIEFDWQDSRTGHLVNSKVVVITSPVQPVNLGVIRLGEVAGSGVIAYLGSADLGWLGKPLTQLAVLMTPVTLAMFVVIASLITVLAIVFSAIAVICTILAVIACIGCFFGFSCGECAYYGYAAAIYLGLAGAIDYVAIEFLNIYHDTPPQHIPCFVIDKDAVNGTSKFPIQVTTTRTTDPSSINYGIYTTKWPFQKAIASGIVEGGGIFPPKQEFDTTPNWDWKL